MNGAFSMIQRCTEQDREGILAYVDGAVDRCLYLYMDLLEFGFDSPEGIMLKAPFIRTT